jgi:hypothetical protein
VFEHPFADVPSGGHNRLVARRTRRSTRNLLQLLCQRVRPMLLLT